MYNTVKIKLWIFRFIQLQLFLTIISFPILVAWGLPLSLMSPISNLIFTPLLTLFLLLSSFIFFTQILCIPNAWFIVVLEWVTKFWKYIVSWGSNAWLIGFAQPHWGFFVILVLSAFFVLQHKKLNSPAISSICFFMLLLGAIGYLKLTQHAPIAINHIPCNKGTLTVIAHKNTTILIDPGFLGQRISAPTWVEYTLIPLLIKDYGNARLDYIIVMQPSIMTFEAMKTLVQLAQVKYIYLVGWEGEGSRQLLGGYGALRRACTQQNVQVVRIGKQQKSWVLDGNISLICKPLGADITYQNIKFPALELLLTMQGQECIVRSAKYKPLS